MLRDLLPTIEDRSRFLTLKELADLLRLSPSSIYRLVDGRTIPFYRIAGSLRFCRTEIEEYIRRGKVETIGNQ